jgi:hypothetical protein
LREIKARWTLFQQVDIDTKHLYDIPEYWIQMKRHNLPSFQYTAREVVSGMMFVSYATECGLTYGTLFAEIITNHLKKCGVKFKNSRFQTDNGSKFIGSPSMNFFEGKVSREDDRTSVRFSDQDSLPIGEARGLDLKDNEVIFGVRPEDVVISLEKKEGWFSGTIFATEPLGNATYVDIQWNVNRLKAEAEPDFQAQPDSPIYFTFKKEKIHLFDKTDGKRLDLASL